MGKYFTLHTDLPNGVEIYSTTTNATLSIDITGDWVVYLETHFKDIPVEIIDARK